MIYNILKFLHIVFASSIIGFELCSFKHLIPIQGNKFLSINLILLLLSGISLIHIAQFDILDIWILFSLIIFIIYYIIISVQGYNKVTASNNKYIKFIRILLLLIAMFMMVTKLELDY